MKKLYALAAFCALAALCFFILRSAFTNSKISFNPHEQEDEMDKAILQEIENTKDPATGTVPVERLFLAEQIQQEKFAEQKRNGVNSAVPGIGWTERGPNNVGGRTRAVLYDRSDASFHKVWAGGVGGGLWYTNDITAPTPVWNKVNDMFDNLAVTSIAQHPDTPSIMYFGTGEGWYPQQGIFGIRGLGIWKSTDGGASWNHLASTTPSTGNPTFYFIQDMKIACCSSDGTTSFHPLLVATKNGGVQQSNDGGSTWTKVLGNGVGGGTTDEAADLEFLYQYTFATLGINGPGGIYRSSNGGDHWDQIYQSAPDEARIKIASAPNAYWKQYALVQKASPSYGIKKIMKTTNADDLPASVVYSAVPNPTWCDNGITRSDFTRGAAWYNLAISVDPWHPDTVYIGGVDLFRSIDAGSTWTQLSQWKNGCTALPYVHADMHEIVFRNPSPFPGFNLPDPEFLVACDGGIFRTGDVAASFTERNHSYNITQYYGCAIHPILPNYFLAGGQDNGTQKFTSPGINSPPTISPSTTVSGGDGGFCFIDQNEPNIQITSYSRNNYNVTTDGGATFISYGFPGGSFINPTDYDNNANILYGDTSIGLYFRWTFPFTYGTMSVVGVPAFAGSEVTHVKVSPTVANRVYFGLRSGSVVRIDNANGAFASTIIKPPGVGVVSCIAVNPSNENHILVTYSNYGVSSIWETMNGGGSWIDDDGGSLPDMPVRWVIFDPRNTHWAIIATEKGIWSTDNLNGPATDWQPTNNNLANTRIDMLQYRPSDGLLLAATHGRGLFSANIPAAATPVTLLNFKGRLQNNEAWLDWQTATEQNNKGFEIERSSDGIQFEKIGFVNSAGNGIQLRSYGFHDPGITQVNNYYKLKQTDLDGKFTFSRVVYIQNPVSDREVFKLLTNPASGHIDLQFGNIRKTKGILNIFDASGRILLNRNCDVVPLSRMRMVISNNLFASGSYYIQLIADNRKYTIKMLIK